MNSQQNQYKWLYKFAWGFEAVAAITGIAMAAVFNAPAYIRYSADGLNATEITFLIGGSLPFLMIAFAELCKIPLVTATIMAKTYGVKLLFGCVTFFASFITFETVYNGLEQTQAQRSMHIFELNAELDNLQNRINTIDNRILIASEKDEELINSEIDRLRDKAYKSFDMRNAVLNDEINKIEKKYLSKYKNIIKPLEAQIEKIEVSQEKKSNTKLNAISSIKSDLDSTRSALAGYEKNLQECGFFSGRCGEVNRDGINSSKERISDLEKSLIEIKSNKKNDNPKITNLLKSIAREQRVIQKGKDKDLQVVESKRQLADKKLQDELKKVNKIAENKKSKLNSNEDKITVSQESKDNILVEIDDVKQKKAIDVNTNLIYRLAGRWFGVTAGDVTERQASIIGTIWNASISIIVAVMGPIIASAYILLNHQINDRPKSIFRALAKAIRSQKRKPKIVEKIVEVDKIIEKEIYVDKFIEVEVEKKIYVDKLIEVEIEKPIIKHVPIFTDDPSLIELSKEWKKS